MAGAPTGDEALTPNNAVNVLEEILEAQNQSYVVGLKLKLPLHVVDAIYEKYSDPRDRLLQVIIEFTKQVEPRPTWRAIVAALRSPAVNLPQLAMRTEAAYCPDPTATRDAPPQTNTSTVAIARPEAILHEASSEIPSTVSSDEIVTGSLLLMTERAHLPDPITTCDAPPMDSTLTVPSSVDMAQSTAVQNSKLMSSDIDETPVKAEIKKFEDKFDRLKTSTIKCLENIQVTVMAVVYTLTSLRAVYMDEHKEFLEKNTQKLNRCQNHWELFGQLNLYWNYLSYHLLDHLIKEVPKKLSDAKRKIAEQSLTDVKRQMSSYEMDLKLFRKRTPLSLFCLVENGNDSDPPPGFRKMVFEYDWPITTTLEDVEIFRLRYVRHYKLRDCAMIVNSIIPGTFTVTWFVPSSTVELLKKRSPNIFKEFNISRLEFPGVTRHVVYEARHGLTSTACTSFSSTNIRKSKSSHQTEDDIPFVEQPSKDFFCPVMLGLLLQPHLTACCGKHLSHEAVTRIQRDVGRCPLCTTKGLKTMLDKGFRRKVNELRVFCRHEDKGCGWEGELSNLDHHVKSCPMKTAPLMTDLLKLPVYSDGKMTSATGKDKTRDQTHETRELTVQSHEKKTTPLEMWRGSATTDNQFAYFTPEDSDSVYKYEQSTDTWERLPPSPFNNSGLFIMNNELSTVGGRDGPCHTNQLFSLQQDKWIEQHPTMNIACSNTATVGTSDGNYVFVIGGDVGDQDWTAKVNLLDVRSRRWHELTKLPHPLAQPSATICGSELHVIGKDRDGYSCSLQDLTSSDQPMRSQSILSFPVTWEPLPRLPVKCSTAASVCGQLVIVGGLGDGSRVNSIRQLVDGRWVEIGSMSSGRDMCLVIAPSPDKLVIVGGRGGEKIVEEFKAV